MRDEAGVCMCRREGHLTCDDGVCGEAGACQEKMLREMYRRVDRHTSRKVPPNKPGELRSYSKIPEQLSESCRKVAPRAEHRPNLAQIGGFGPDLGQNLVDVASCLSWSVWTIFCFSRTSAKSTDNLAASTKCGRDLPKFVRIRLRCGPNGRVSKTDYDVMLLGVKAAFLYGALRRNVHIEFPRQDPRYGDGGVMGKLIKALYGTGLAPDLGDTVKRDDELRCCHLRAPPVALHPSISRSLGCCSCGG